MNNNADNNEKSTVQSSIDKLTMEFMMNRVHYKRYLSKQDPQKFQENQEYIQKIKKYKTKIMNMMNALLENSINSTSEKYTRDINDTFNEYLKTSITHFELQELENSNESFQEQSQDTLFESIESPKLNNSFYTMDKYVKRSSDI